MDSFRVRLNCIDHYQAPPTRYDPPLRKDVQPAQLSLEAKVPVIRVFGSTETGQKVCAHIHGAFPYLYVEYGGSLAPEEVSNYIYQLHLSIDHALAVSYRRNNYRDNPRYVARITLVKGVPFYGFYVGYRFFLKIYMLNPVVMTRLADLLQQGAIMKRQFQLYEAHLEYLLQFMVDYNLYGCDYLDSSKTHFRMPIPIFEHSSNYVHLWHSRSIRSRCTTEDPSLPRASHCALEVDICVKDIINRRKVKPRLLHHDFVERLNPVPNDIKLVHSMAGLWDDEMKRRRREMQPMDEESSQFLPDEWGSQLRPDALLSLSGDARDSQTEEWLHEEEFRHEIQRLIDEEAKDSGPGLTFGNFATPRQFEENVQTALESVQDLYPSNLMPLLGLPSSLESSQDPSSSIEVDEGKVAQAEEEFDDFFSQDSDTEATALVESVEQEFAAAKASVDRQTKTEGDSAGKLDGSSLLRSVQGLCESGLKTGKLPVMPFYSDLVELADESDHDSSMEDAMLENSDCSLAPSGPPPSQLSGDEGGGDDDDDDTRLEKVRKALETVSTSNTYIYSSLPPTVEEVTSTFKDYGLPDVVYQDPFYSRPRDLPSRKREYAGKEFRLASKTLRFLPKFDPTGLSPTLHGLRQVKPVSKKKMQRRYGRQRRKCPIRSWEIAKLPPSYAEVEAWCDEQDRLAAEKEARGVDSVFSSSRGMFSSQIDGPTPESDGSKPSQGAKASNIEHEVSYMSTMSLEVHVNTRGKLVPDPEEDAVECVFWALMSDEIALESDSVSASPEEMDLASDDEATPKAMGGTEPKRKSFVVIKSGIVVLSRHVDQHRRIQQQTGGQVLEEPSELDLLVRMIEIVRDHDPDILTGYEVHSSSWGYLVERAKLKYDFDLCDEFSRMRTESQGKFGQNNARFGRNDYNNWGFNTTSSIRVTGRHMINIWRAMRGELHLTQYTMENVAWHLLRRRIPHHSWETLTGWYRSGKPRELAQLLRYYKSRTKLDLEIIDANELVVRTSEQARVLGVDFFSVFSRGSQFKVESIMFRIAKPENFMLVSPNRRQVGAQNALECLPLVMEPESAFYNSPLVVLDFQSLYPSIMIAYNYCYSTFLGRITNWKGMNKMGFTEYRRRQGLLELLQDCINIAPNGMMYVKAEIRKSLLAKMLVEILETRVMVKNSMKQDKDNRALQTLLNNRQLALKLLANVTYGYTSASFSGRMPCSEIADSIVQTARETLERAVSYIQSIPRWRAQVVYGDTDSLFVYLKGRTREEAFEIGQEMAKAITEMNPKPVKLKFEKVYHPCVLLAKKRYVGYKFESKGQVKPEFEAKGIETVRRDGTPAVQKMEEKILRLLFDTADLSKIKSYFRKQCNKVMHNKVSVQDFCFAKEVRLGTYSGKGAPPAGALISTKKMAKDARAEPQYGERVPYVVIRGAPKARLVDRSVAPEDLLSNPQWQLDAEYYIAKNLIPPLERILSLVGASAQQWYDGMPKVRRINRAAMVDGRKGTIESYMRSLHCISCNVRCKQNRHDSLCRRCRASAARTLPTLQTRVATEERKLEEILAVCRSCSGLGPLEEVTCDSKDCPVFWTRMRQWTKMRVERHVTAPAIKTLSLEW